jgi:alkanesulfonate monooxygenase SsuD/methylene tetrahydromethanopterin reductase-like flavin-dependent oxidoreductase (luciferase family)
VRLAWAFDHNVPAEIEREIIHIAEREGLEAIYTMEHFHLRDGVTTAAFVAAHSNTLRVVMGVLSPFFRHPIEIGITAANLQRISGGRAVLNLGAGMPETLERIGIHFERPVQRLRETIEIIDLLFAGERFSYAGECFHIEKHHLTGDRVPRPPIVISAMCPRIIELAGEVADGVNLPLASSPEYIAQSMDHFTRGGQKAGRDRGLQTVSAEVLVEVGDDDAWAGIRRLLAFHYSSKYFEKVAEPSGIRLDHAAIKQAFLQRDDAEIRRLIPDHVLHAFSAVGSADDILTRLEAYEQAGAGLILLYTAGEAEARLRTITEICQARRRKEETQRQA